MFHSSSSSLSPHLFETFPGLGITPVSLYDMTDFLQLVGTDTPNAVGSCCLVTDDVRVLFNCPEGAQRHFSEAKLRTSKTSTFLFTRVDVSTIMGLPGFLFTIHDGGCTQCTFGGPLAQLATFLRRTADGFFGFRSMRWELIPPLHGTSSYGMNASPPRHAPLTLNCGFKLRHPDHCQSSLDDAAQATLEEWLGGAAAVQPGDAMFHLVLAHVTVLAFCSGFTKPTRVLPSSQHPIISYALVENDRVMFCPVKARQLGVLPGIKYSKLKNGASVTSDIDPSVTVHPQDVVTCIPGTAVSFILDADDTVELVSALACVAQRSWFPSKKISTIVHVARAELTVGATDYMATVGCTSWWAASLHWSTDKCEGCEHVFASHVHGEFSAFPTALVHRYHLSAISPENFPLHATESSQWLPAEHVGGDCTGDNGSSGDDGNARVPSIWPYSRQFRVACHRPAIGRGAKGREPTARDGNCALHSDAGVVKYPTVDSAIRMLSEPFRDSALVNPPAHAAPERLEHAEPVNGGAPEVLFLGTGSSVPSKYRNVSGILLRLPGSGPAVRVVMDCGEGTMGQLLTNHCLPGSFTAECVSSYEACVASIEVIFISHSHADHNLGLLTLLHEIHRCRSRRAALGHAVAQKLVLVGPSDFCHYIFSLGLVSLSALVEDCHLFIDTFCHTGPMFLQCPLRSSELRSRGTSALSRSPPPVPVESFPLTIHLTEWARSQELQCSVFPVDHPAHAHGFAVSSRKCAFSVLYSGDTRPDATLVERGIAFGPLTALIHEATFDDELEEEAARKSHSTTRGALEVAEHCGAKSVILTHFSQRYPKAPPVAVMERPSAIQENRVVARAPAAPVVVFSFDFLRVSLTPDALSRLQNRSPAFSALLAEYESWESGTSKRLREE